MRSPAHISGLCGPAPKSQQARLNARCLLKPGMTIDGAVSRTFPNSLRYHDIRASAVDFALLDCRDRDVRLVLRTFERMSGAAARDYTCEGSQAETAQTQGM